MAKVSFESKLANARQGLSPRDLKFFTHRGKTVAKLKSRELRKRLIRTLLDTNALIFPDFKSAVVGRTGEGFVGYAQRAFMYDLNQVAIITASREDPKEFDVHENGYVLVPRAHTMDQLKNLRIHLDGDEPKGIQTIGRSPIVGESGGVFSLSDLASYENRDAKDLFSDYPFIDDKHLHNIEEVALNDLSGDKFSIVMMVMGRHATAHGISGVEATERFIDTTFSVRQKVKSSLCNELTINFPDERQRWSIEHYMDANRDKFIGGEEVVKPFNEIY